MNSNGSMKYPDDLGYIVMNTNEIMYLMCEKFIDLPKAIKIIPVTCSSGTTFSYEYNREIKRINILDLTCELWPKPKTQTMKRCMTNYDLIDVFFEIENIRIPLYTSCYDPNACHVHYVNHISRPTYHQKNHTFSWRKPIFACNVTLYTKLGQIETFNKTFPPPNLVYIGENSFLSKGEAFIFSLKNIFDQEV